jgi:hypothetical protein
MTKGPLGGSRPLASANVQITFLANEAFTASDQMLKRDLSKLLGYNIDVASGVEGGPAALADFFAGGEIEGYLIVVTVEDEKITLEELNLIVDKINKSARNEIPEERILIGTTGGEGPIGAPRPMATSSVNLMFNSGDEMFYISEVSLEVELRQRYGEAIDVTVGGAMQFAGITITVITGDAEIPLDEVEGMQNSVEDITDHNFPARNIDITAR